PKLLNFLAAIDPLSYGVDGLRNSFAGVSHFGLSTDLATLFVLSAVLLAAGSYLFSRIQL
ncbi:MAG: ABC transporter permease, partial [Bryobacteraceae bacterium]